METEKEILMIESKESTIVDPRQRGAPLESEEVRQAYGYGHRIHTSEVDPQFSDEDDDQPPFQSASKSNMVSEMYVSSTATKEGERASAEREQSQSQEYI